MTGPRIRPTLLRVPIDTEWQALRVGQEGERVLCCEG
jgi:hypothetical protein